MIIQNHDLKEDPVRYCSVGTQESRIYFTLLQHNLHIESDKILSDITYSLNA
jgi:hypothetical protein